MKKLSKRNIGVLVAYKKGYRVNNSGDVISHLGNKRVLSYNSWGYGRFAIKGFNGERFNVPVHKLVAYQKYGDSLFGEGICVRHLDGDSKNNKPDNIAIGTLSDNMMDQPKRVRIAKARKAAKVNRRFCNEEVVELRKLFDFYPLPKVAKVYSTSKSTMSYIKNRKTYKDA